MNTPGHSVIVAARETSVYVRQINDTGRQDHTKEGNLAVRWTELGFLLGDLGLKKLAKRCDIKGRYWAQLHKPGIRGTVVWQQAWQYRNEVVPTLPGPLPVPY